MLLGKSAGPAGYVCVNVRIVCQNTVPVTAEVRSNISLCGLLINYVTPSLDFAVSQSRVYEMAHPHSLGIEGTR